MRPKFSLGDMVISSMPYDRGVLGTVIEAMVRASGRVEYHVRIGDPPHSVNARYEQNLFAPDRFALEKWLDAE